MLENVPNQSVGLPTFLQLACYILEKMEKIFAISFSLFIFSQLLVGMKTKSQQDEYDEAINIYIVCC